MTVEEFSLEFDVIYNSIASNAAQPVNGYEKSVFLTQAQEELVKNYYNPKGNKYAEGFEVTEKRRRDFEQLVKNGVSSSWLVKPSESLTTFSLSSSAFTGDLLSMFFAIEDDVMFIIAEKAMMASSDKCYNNKVVSVKPISHNELSININNPFKRPKDFFWRVDREKITGDFNGLAPGQTKRVIELLHDNLIGFPKEYRYRYIKFPQPIVLEDLTQYGPNVSINGVTDAQTSELSDHMNREILNRAVELALEASGNPRTESKIQLNQRSE